MNDVLNAILHDTTFWQCVGYVLGGLIVLAAVSFASQWIAKNGKKALYYIKRYEPTVISAVDQPGDPLIIQLSKLTGLAPADLVGVLPPMIRGLADGIEALAPKVETVK